MTEQQLQQLWVSCLQYIKDNIEEATFDTWFRPMTFQSFDGQKLHVAVPSEFFCEYIEKNYARLLCSAVFRYFGNGTKINFQYRIGSEHVEQAAAVNSTGFSPFNMDTRFPNELDPHLNLSYTFERFLDGASNHVPLTIAREIAKGFQDAFNPFFIYGPSGIGKTHLANAIGIQMKENYPEKRVLYLSASRFCQQYQQACQPDPKLGGRNHFNDFIGFYQSIDALIIDDIQEIAGKKMTQEALFTIFNHLQLHKRQLIFTCDRPPVMLEGMQENLLNRFKWGVFAELERPDAKLRKDIVEEKVRQIGLSFPQNVINYIASTVQDSIREIEGVISSILAFSVATKEDITMALAERTIARTVNLHKAPVTTEAVVKHVAAVLHVNVREINSSTRRSDVALARQVAMYLTQKHTSLSSAQIGKQIGNRDHTTVLYACDKIEKKLNADRDFRMLVQDIERKLEQR